MKAIIFDLDGTLGNTLPLCIAAFKKSIEPLAGRVLSDEEIVATFGPSEEGTISALIPEHYDRGVEDYLAHYRELHGMCPAPFDGIVDVLEHLRSRGVRIALVTGKGGRSADITLEAFGLGRYFEAVETGSPLGPRKVEGIAGVLEKLGVSPEAAVYVGDSPSDVTASREAGVQVVAAAWAETAEPEKLSTMKPDAMCRTIEEFAQYARSVWP